MNASPEKAGKTVRLKKPARAYHHGDLRNALLGAALKVLSAQGVDALTLREVAHLTGVTPSALYRHFSSKEHLLAAIAADGYRVIAAGFEQAQQESDAQRQLQLLADTYVEFALAHPEQYRLMFSGKLGNFDQYPELVAVARPLSQMLVAACARFMDSGVSTAFATPLDFAVAAWSLVHGYCRLTIDGELSVFPGELRPRPHAVLGVLWHRPGDQASPAAT